MYQCHQQTAFKTSLIDWANEIQMVVADGVVVMDMKFWMQACVTLGLTASILIQHSTCVTLLLTLQCQTHFQSENNF